MTRRRSTSKTTAGRANSTGTGVVADSVAVKKPRARALKNSAHKDQAATTLNTAMIRSIATINEDAVAFSTRSIEQTVAVAGALVEARTLGDAIDLQIRGAAEAWHQALDYWVKVGQTTARTAQKGLFGL